MEVLAVFALIVFNNLQCFKQSRRYDSHGPLQKLSKQTTQAALDPIQHLTVAVDRADTDSKVSRDTTLAFCQSPHAANKFSFHALLVSLSLKEALRPLDISN